MIFDQWICANSRFRQNSYKKSKKNLENQRFYAIIKAMRSALSKTDETIEESIPPDKKVHIGTSDIICILILSSSSQAVFSKVSS
jgi:hypothetical protein